MSGDEALGVALGTCAAEILELAAFRGQAPGIESLLLAHGGRAAPFGACAAAPDHVVLGMRPERWLLLSAPDGTGAGVSLWAGACTGIGAVIELSSAFAVFQLAGPSARQVLARGCRLDLRPQAFPVGRAAATQMAQVSVVLAALPAGWLLLSPSTTARHFHDWLAAAAQPFGLRPLQESSVARFFEPHPS